MKMGTRKMQEKVQQFKFNPRRRRKSLLVVFGFNDGLRLLVVIVSNNGILLILVFRDQVANVLVGFLELHLVHALALVPVKEGLPLVHGAELRGQSLEDSLEGRGVGDERAGGFVIDGGALHDGGLLVVRDPLDEVVRVGGVPLLAHLVEWIPNNQKTSIVE